MALTSVAVVFAWAAGAKVAGWHRWRRALSAHALPRWVERVAVWAVPAAESLVPILTLLGRERAAAAVALASVALFSIALLRSAARDGVRVACGCFGRASIDVRVALSRNLVLAAAAIVSFALAVRDPALTLPQAGDALPALLLAGALATAAITAWRTAVWLGRSRV